MFYSADRARQISFEFRIKNECTQMSFISFGKIKTNETLAAFLRANRKLLP